MMGKSRNEVLCEDSREKSDKKQVVFAAVPIPKGREKGGRKETRSERKDYKSLQYVRLLSTREERDELRSVTVIRGEKRGC